jgi:hypothetical protein
MLRFTPILLAYLCVAPAPALAQTDCKSANEMVAKASGLLQSAVGRDELENIRQLLIRASALCPGNGDAYYHRHRCEKLLGNSSAAEYALKKARDLNSPLVRSAGGEEAKGRAHAPSDRPDNKTSGGDRDTVSPHVREKWALVVGISRFRNPRHNLNYPAKDAKDFASLLTSPAYGRFKPKNVRLLLDEQATTTQILKELNWLARSAERDDLVVIYLSSHGSPGEMDTVGVSYIITHDTVVENEDELFATALSMKKDLAEALNERIKAQRVAVFLDTCYSGAALPGAKALVAGGVSGDTLNRIRQGVGRIIISSSGAKEKSWESETLKNSYFTHYLMEGLRQNNGLVPLETVYSRLSDAVGDHVRKEKGASQKPVMSRSDTSAGIILGVGPTSPP